jgi:hypothetical protein
MLHSYTPTLLLGIRFIPSPPFVPMPLASRLSTLATALLEDGCCACFAGFTPDLIACLGLLLISCVCWRVLFVDVIVVAVEEVSLYEVFFALGSMVR